MLGHQTIRRDGKARLGRLSTPHGTVETPVFMPVGTAGSVKGVTPDQLRAAGAGMILANTYHLLLRPGAETVAALGGLHRLMGWDGPILTDSGGFQVFSLAHLRRLSDEAAVFQSHVDGSEVTLTPRRCIEVQRMLGADVIMQLDECPPGKADRDVVERAVERSIRWAAVCKEAWTGELRTTQTELASHPTIAALQHSTIPSPRPQHSAQGRHQALFGIQQGGIFADLRRRSAEALRELDLPGYAVGGLSVGEGHDAACGVLDDIDELLPADRPRYLMGVGEPRDILAAVLRGIDLFDCVMPTRNARNAQVFTRRGRLRLRNARWARDARPLEEDCPCYACRNFSRGTLRHLFLSGEMLGPTLATIHNLQFFSRFLAAIRAAIAEGRLAPFARDWQERFYDAGEEEKRP
jgi:queuine tRNA-ribosyltransferase